MARSDAERAYDRYLVTAAQTGARRVELDAMHRALLERYGHEPGYVRKAFGLFTGRLAWTM